MTQKGWCVVKLQLIIIIIILNPELYKSKFLNLKDAYMNE